MEEGNKSDGQTPLPAQQAQQPQPTTLLNDHQIQSPHMNSISDVFERSGKDRPASSDSGDGGEPTSDGQDGGAALDDARFTAGVVKLYEALLKEPVPEEMLRLIDKLGKQERK